MALEVTFLKKVFSPAAERAISKLAAGDSYEEAAAELHRDKETVKSYAAVFRQTMHAKSTLEAVAKAVARGIISIKEIDGKTLIACGLIFTSFQSDFVMARSVRTTKLKRRDDAITQSENGGEMVSAWHQGADLRHLVPGGFCDRAVR
jgi:DNA-binding CsgD family transcriptional regulator